VFVSLVLLFLDTLVLLLLGDSGGGVIYGFVLAIEDLIDQFLSLLLDGKSRP